MGIPLPVIPDVYRVTANWLDSTTSQTAANVLHIHAEASGSTYTQAKDALLTSWKANMQLFMPTTVHLVSFDIIALNGTAGTATYPTGNGAPFTGGSAVDFAPAVAVLVKHQTLGRGPANRGRTYSPFVSESQMTNGSLISADPPLVTTAWGQFQAALLAHSGMSFTQVVASYDRKNGGAGANFSLITNTQCETVLATQRRRQTRLR